MGVQRLARGQGSLLLETALKVTLEQLAGVTGALPVPHQSFLPPSQRQPYWDQLADVYGESGREGWCLKPKSDGGPKCRRNVLPLLSILCINVFAVFFCFFPDEPGFYPRVLSLCRALSQYLLSVGQLPSSLHIPSDKEHLITTFTCTAAEVKYIKHVILFIRLLDSFILIDWYNLIILNYCGSNISVTFHLTILGPHNFILIAQFKFWC